MAIEVALDLKQFPKGQMFDVGGLALENGKTTKLSEEQEAAFVARNGGKSVREALKGNDAITVSGTSTAKGGETS